MVLETVLKFADLTLNVSTREVTRGSRKVDLTTKEFDLLHFFMLHPRQVLTREVSQAVEARLKDLRAELAVAREQPLDAVRLDQIDADAVDHAPALAMAAR